MMFCNMRRCGYGSFVYIGPKIALMEHIYTKMYNAYWRDCVLRKAKEPCHAMMAPHAKEGLMKKSERVKSTKKKLGLNK